MSTRSLSIAALVLALSALLSPAKSQAQFNDQSVVNMYIYQGQGRATWEKQLKTTVDARIEMIEKACKIDAAGSRKLRFAAKGDLSRFMNQVDELEEATKDLNIQDQADMQKAWEAVQPLYEKAQSKNILDDSSFFMKLMPKLLSGEQKKAYERHLQARAATRREALMRATVIEIENSMPLLAKQREKLFKVLMDREPLKNVPQGYEPFLGYIQLCKSDTKELSEFLDAKQMKVIEEYRDRYRGYAWAGN